MSLNPNYPILAPNKWYNGLSFDEAIHWLYVDQTYQLWCIYQSKGCTFKEFCTIIKDYKVWEFQKYLRYANGYLNLKIPEGIVRDYLQNDKVLQWCLKNKIPRGNRKMVLFKNIAKGLCSSALPLQQKEQIAEKIMSNAEDIQFSKSIQYWMTFFHDKPCRYNKYEVNTWLDMHGLKELKY